MNNKEEYLYLIWNDPVESRSYIVGKLTKRQEGYLFEYCGDYKDAVSNAGWELLEAFPEEKVYSKDRMFPTFASRLPDKKRADIRKVLRRYSMTEYDDYELLKRSSGKLPIDTLEFKEKDKMVK